MENILQKYDLPDLELRNDDNSSYRYLIWQPQEVMVILGRSNQVSDAVFLENCQEDKIPIIQRPTGGQSVVLSPKMLAISILAGEEREKQLPSKEYFRIYNERIMAGLAHLGVKTLEYKGISDITLNGKKIAGTALYRNRQKVFYHAILNIGEDPFLLERYLRYPVRAPEYREKRQHHEFVTSIHKEGFSFSHEKIEKAIAQQIQTW